MNTKVSTNGSNGHQAPTSGGSGRGFHSAPTALDFDSADILQAMWRRRWTTVACCVMGLVGGFVYLWQATPIYESKSKIYIEQNTPPLATGLYAPQAISNMSYYDGSPFLYSQAELIRSHDILSRAVEKSSLGNLESVRGTSNPVGRVKSMLKAMPDEKSGTLSVSAQSTVSKDAAVVVNSAVEAYIDHVNAKKRSSAAEVLQILRSEKEKQEKELKDLNEKVLAFHREHKTLSFDSNQNAVAPRLTQLSEALSKAKLDATNARIAVETLNAAAGDSVTIHRLIAGDKEFAGQGGVGGAAVGLLAEQEKVSAELLTLRAATGPKHPKVVQLENKLAGLEWQIRESGAGQKHDDLVDIYRQAVDQRLKAAGDTEARLQAEYDAERETAVNLNALGVEYGQYQTQVKRIGTQLDTIDARIKELNVNDNTDAISATILEPAAVASAPVSPNRPRTVGVSLLLGLMFGAGLAVLLEWMDERMHSSDEIASVVNAPLVGLIPHVDAKASSSPAREVDLHPKSNTAEAFRTVRTAIHFGAPKEGSKVVHITSPSPGDGKSLVSANLAIAFAQTGKRVVLIDADCRRPSQHRLFGVSKDVGLSSVLLGQARLKEAIHATPVPNLHLMPSGPIPTNPAELLNSAAFTKLLQTLAKVCDHVVVDSPPIMPVTDSRIIAARCDFTLLVLRAEKSTRRVAQHAAEALRSVSAKLLGIVVNDIPRNRDGYGYYGKYGYPYHGYGYGHETENGHKRREAEAAVLTTTEPSWPEAAFIADEDDALS
ncbi:MAG TPA: polysaccharide biosynthesis tyrosine autokinase [Nonomuraea sp.]|nr:polysaccharide biosynthesis tyrosine autokinase [Nonomuraea sp.]